MYDPEDPPHSCPSCGFSNGGAGITQPIDTKTAYEARMAQAKKSSGSGGAGAGVSRKSSVFKGVLKGAKINAVSSSHSSHSSHSWERPKTDPTRAELKALEEERKRIEQREKDMMKRLEEKEKELAAREEKLKAIQHSHSFTVMDFVTKRDFAEVKEKLSRGENPNERNEAGSCLLHVAASMGDVKIMEILIHWGASIDAKDSEGRTPMAIASLNKHKKAVKLLNSCYKQTAFFRRISDKSVSDESVLDALDASVHDINISWWSKYGLTPLHLAVQHGRWKVVKGIVERDGDVNKPDANADTPLHHFVKHYGKFALIDMMEMLMVLLGAGAIVEDSYNADGKTPLMLLDQHSPISNVLTQQNLRAVPNDRLKAWITSQVDLESSWDGLRHGTKRKERDEEDEQAKKELREGRKKAEHLFDRYSGLFPAVLFASDEVTHEAMMDKLEKKWSADMEKCIRRAERVHKAMAKGGPNLGKRDMELLNHELRFHQEILKRCESLEKKMFRFGSSRILWDMRDRVPDMVAAVLIGGAREGKKHIIQGVIKWGHEPNACVRTHSKMAAIHGAASEGPSSIVDLLVKEFHADVNIQDNSHNTPLHYAAKRGRRDVVRQLVKLGADEAVRNAEGRTYKDELRIKDLAELMQTANMPTTSERPSAGGTPSSGRRKISMDKGKSLISMGK